LSSIINENADYLVIIFYYNLNKNCVCTERHFEEMKVIWGYHIVIPYHSALHLTLSLGDLVLNYSKIVKIREAVHFNVTKNVGINYVT
jgi:hypothetical protein